MIETTNKVHIERSASYIFDFIADIENSTLFDQFGIRVIKVSSAPIGMGSEYQMVHANYKRLLRVVDFEKDHIISFITMEASAPRVELRVQLVPEPNQFTLLVMEWKLATGLPGLVERMFAGRMIQTVSDHLLDLRELLETGSVILRNGHEIQLPQ